MPDPTRHVTSVDTDLRIRAVRSYPKEHGKEAPHVTLSASDKADLARIAEIIEFKTIGSAIFSQGEEARYFYLLASGVVRIQHILQNGERQVLGFYWPGDLFGLAENGFYCNCSETIAESKVYRFPVAILENFLLKHPSVQDGFFVKAVHDLRNTQRQLIVMGKLDIPRRLAAFLLDCSGHANYFDSEKKLLTLPMSRGDIADYLGTSAETVARALGRLETAGMINRVASRAIELKTGALRAFIGLG